MVETCNCLSNEIGGLPISEVIAKLEEGYRFLNHSIQGGPET